MQSSLNQSSTANSASKASTIEEVGIVIGAKDLAPHMASHDFLKASGIVPQDWELSKQPVQGSAGIQLSYTNGLNITAQPRTITFSETITGKTPEKIFIAKLAERYVSKLPNAAYLGMSCTPKILIPYPSNPSAVRQFIGQRLLGSGSWKNIGKTPVQAGINLMYLLERCQLTISVAEAKLQQANKPALAAILFSGGFNYNVAQDTSSEQRLIQLKKALNFWQQDLLEFRDIVATKFMEIPEATSTLGSGSLFPEM